MKTIGLIGGMSWESTAEYYRIINETVNSRMGGYHSAKCLMYSVDFAEIEECQTKGDWEQSGLILADAAMRLEKAGADFILRCTNTMHKVLPQMEAAVCIPFIHIADATADVLEASRISRVGLLGTKYTMTQAFMKQKLLDRGFAVLIPDETEIDVVNSVIYDELCRGILSEKSRAAYVKIIDRLHQAGAQGIILGCTEIGLLVDQSHTKVPLFNTTVLHAEKAAILSLS
jgi:aspartate racemase